METLDYFGHTIRKWSRGASTFLAYPENGARLMNWHLKMADGSVRDVIFWPEITKSDDPLPSRGGNPILFPFSARTFDQGDIHFWRHEKIRRPMPMHGFARNSVFEMTEFDENGFAAVLQPGKEAIEAYPFDYEFTVIYRFQELSFWVEFRLLNKGDEPLPWSAGHHFYFQLPWHDGASRSDYRIDIPARKAFRHQSDGRLEPAPPFEQSTSFDDPALVDRIHTRLKENVVRFGPKNGEEDIVMRLQGGDSSATQPSDQTVVTWSESETAPYYCVEPWMGPPNSPEHKKGLNFVPPKKTGVFSVEVSLG